MAEARNLWLRAILDHPALRSKQEADGDRSQIEASKKFLRVLEFIGHQETSSGCGLMGLGEKILFL